ncbi:hypothetical protein AHAS_Ahas13G0095100 [Arachis hypogaea]
MRSLSGMFQKFIYGLVDHGMCLWPSADSSKNGDPKPDFYRLLLLALDPILPETEEVFMHIRILSYFDFLIMPRDEFQSRFILSRFSS